MSSTATRILFCTLVTIALANGKSAQAAKLFGDTFETGTNAANVGAPWGANNLTAVTYSNVATPFTNGGSVYADFNDASTTAGVRLLSNAGNDNSLSPNVAGLVTTYSFQFWEPTRSGDVNSMIFGYYRQQGNPDLNSAGRNFSATLHDGNLNPQGTVLGGAAITYSTETVNTVFMFANDSAEAVTNYASSGRDLAATSADVWIARGVLAPEYAFSVAKQSTASAISGVGLRSNNADVERFSVDNVLLASGATFDRSTLFAFPSFSVDRGTGVISINNTSSTSITVKGYTLTSAAGSLKPDSWASIADTGDADSGNSFDSTGIWTETSSISTLLSESTPGSGGTLAATNGTRSLGPAWARTPYQDVVANYVLSDGSTGSVAVTYSGTALSRSNLNGDNAINAADWLQFLSGSGQSFAGQTRVQSYFAGDLDGDLDNDLADFRLFQADFVAANGQAAFNALLGIVPEPSALALAAIGVASIAFRRRGRAALLLMLGLAFTIGLGTHKASAATAVTYAASADPGLAPDANAQSIDAWTTTPTAGSGSGFFGFPANGIPANHWVLFSFPAGGTPGSITADHTFDGGPLSVGQAVRLDFANSAVAAGGSVGVSLMSFGAPVATFKFNGGDTEYRIDDALGTDQSTGRPFAFRSLSSLEFRIDSANTYTAAYGNANGSSLWSGTTNGDPIEGIRVFNTLGNNGSDVLFDNLTVGTTSIVPLTLEVNKTTGEIKIKGNPTLAGSIDYYQITSAASALNFAPGTGANQWNSLDLQNLNAVDGTTDPDLVAGNSPTEGWDSATNVSKGRLAEYFIRPGGSAVPTGGALSIGRAYDASVFPGADGDLAFSFAIAGSSRLMSGVVSYITSAGVIGDYNNDGTVNAADYVVWRNVLGQIVELPNRDPGNGTGAISSADYNSWKSHFGLSGTGSAALNAGGVPEPCSGVLLLAALGAQMFRRR